VTKDEQIAKLAFSLASAVQVQERRIIRTLVERKPPMRRILLLAAALISSPVLAEDEFETVAPGDIAAVAPAAGTDAAMPAIDMTVAKSVARQIAQQYRITPEKRAALGKIAREQEVAMAPHLKSLATAAEGFAKDPKMQADMKRFANDMQGLMARQLPQLLAALRPMIQEALPQLLEAQAKALRTLSVPTAVDPYEGQ
jgi:hypothetical protein